MLRQSNGCMKSLQVFKGQVNKNGYQLQSILPFFYLYFSKFNSHKPRT